MTYPKLCVKMALLGLFLNTSCATRGPSSQPFIERNVSKTPATQKTLPKAGEKIAPRTASTSNINLVDIYRTLLQTGSNLSESSLAQVNQLSIRNDRTPLEQAVVFLAILSSQLPKSNSTESTLQNQSLRFKLDPAYELRSNPFLQSIQIADHTINYLRMSFDDPSYKKNILQIVESNANSWNQLWKTVVGDSSFENRPTNTEEQTITVIPTPSPSGIDPNAYQSADLRLGDTILQQAKRLAEKGRYKNAIGHANKVSNNDPFYPEAQEKIKNFSNLAVQDLRQKAAQAFQSSIPVDDVETKTAYLEEAKRYLEEALKEYPAADHLKTVEENLSVITRDLGTIKEQNNY